MSDEEKKDNKEESEGSKDTGSLRDSDRRNVPGLRRCLLSDMIQGQSWKEKKK